MQWEHIVVLSGQDLVTGLDDQPVPLVVEPTAGMVGVGRRLFQYGVSRDHLARDEVMADAEMFQRALRLRPPQLVSGHLDHTHAVGYFTNLAHVAALLRKTDTNRSICRRPRGRCRRRCRRAAAEAAAKPRWGSLPQPP